MQTETDDATQEATSWPTRPIRVLSVPAAHPYPQRVGAHRDVRVLADPPVVGAPSGVWWPPAVLDPEWILAHAADVDVLHIHFGTESFAPGHVTMCIAAAHAAGWRVVYTAHDLDHPQLADSAGYRRQLDELIGGADEVITLTSGAADEIAEGWGRAALVFPHPSIVSADAVVPPVPAEARLRVGVHLKDLRPNVDGPGTVRTLRTAIAQLREEGMAAQAEVRLHRRVRDAAAAQQVRDLCADADELSLIEEDRLDDAALHLAISALDACLLPYRHGTHSGWLEMCWDLGVPVAAPRTGHYDQQHPDGSVAVFKPADGADLARALRDLWGRQGARPGSLARADIVAERRSARALTDAAVASAHAQVYRRLRDGVTR